jgi:hypothetical protein
VYFFFSKLLIKTFVLWVSIKITIHYDIHLDNFDDNFKTYNKKVIKQDKIWVPNGSRTRRVLRLKKAIKKDFIIS